MIYKSTGDESPEHYFEFSMELLRDQRFAVTDEAWRSYKSYEETLDICIPRMPQLKVKNRHTLPLYAAITATIGPAVAVSDEEEDTWTEREAEVYELIVDLAEAVWTRDRQKIALARGPVEQALKDVFASRTEVANATDALVETFTTAADIMQQHPEQDMNFLLNTFANQPASRVLN